MIPGRNPGALGGDTHLVDVDDLEALAASVNTVPAYDPATGEAVLVAHGVTYVAGVGAMLLPGCPLVQLARLDAAHAALPQPTGPREWKPDPPEWQIERELDRRAGGVHG